MTEITHDSLDECPWQPLAIKDHSLIAKCFTANSACEVLFSDFNIAWYEKLSPSAVLERNARLNPSIETSADRLLGHVIKILTTGCQSVNQSKDGDGKTSKLDVMIRSNDHLKVVSESQLCGLLFIWEFDMTRRHDDLITKQLTQPLIAIAMEMSRRQRELIKILGHKDAQIADYKAEGVKIHRKHKNEKPFDEKHFHEEMSLSEEFLVVAVTTNSVVLDPEFQDLYSSIMKARRFNEKYDESNNDVATSQSTLPVMKSATIAISNKAAELERRRALQNQLAVEKTKKEIESKRKKLKL